MRDELARSLDWQQLQVLGFTSKDKMLSSPAYQAQQGEIKAHLTNIAGWADKLGDETPASLLAIAPGEAMNRKELGDFKAYSMPNVSAPHANWTFFFSKEDRLFAARRDQFVLFFEDSRLSSAQITSRTTAGVWVLSFYPSAAPRIAMQISTDSTPTVNGDALIWSPSGELLLEKHASAPVPAEQFLKDLDANIAAPQKAVMNWELAREVETLLRQPPSH
jgi:hypothetical protein